MRVLQRNEKERKGELTISTFDTPPNLYLKVNVVRDDEAVKIKFFHWEKLENAAFAFKPDKIISLFIMKDESQFASTSNRRGITQHRGE